MKRFLSLLATFALLLTIVACTKEVEVPVEIPIESLDGTYMGWSWKGESKGTTLEEASQKIQTIITIDDDGIITDASVLFFKSSQGSWYTRQDSTARISADLSITPTAATPGSEYAKGTSMFNIDTHDKMSLYAVKVDPDGSAALLIVEPVTRYQFEIKLPADYDYSILLGDVTVDGTEGGFIPTVRTSGAGLMKPNSWDELTGKNILSISHYNHILIDFGVFAGLSETSTMKELMEAAGVTFTNGTPNELPVTLGRHSKGGWQGNYEAIEEYLIGKNATELTSLVDWSVERWALAINEDNFFGVDYDASAGATKSAQNSYDGIAGATVRMSRESTSYQRALVDAKILTEEEVIKGRF
ncbi:hypothetical protein KHQ82_01845 [Mycoplasmatota bacterium]|nr:hypothetical protein KHQ82_01845 [Mycoplasmatota bacterium]